MTKEILSGNEAIGLGAYLAGVAVAAAYPGTPSSEIIPSFAGYGVGHAEWSTNEKVALEVAIGACYQGGRALAAMKHVGLNVAADPFFSVSYSGVRGGLVIITADDVGMFSSQNEQDNRHLARAAKVVLLEPADSQECLDFMRLAFEISERYDTPVLLRTTTRISHAKSVVEYDLDTRTPIAVQKFEPNLGKYVLLPAVSRRRRLVIEERLRQLEELGETTPLNRIEWGRDRRLGVITSGISYQYAREALPNASILKLGLSWPLPPELVTSFVRGVERVVVIEETEPFLESEVRMLGLDVLGKRFFTSTGEYSVDLIRRSLSKLPELGIAYQPPEIYKTETSVPDRPPVLCPGCSHRGVFYTLARLKATVFGDIGCYTLGATPPLSALHTCLCMGASINMAFGAEKAAAEGGKDEGYRVAVIGDSTFMHSGITGMINAAYNQGCTKIIILDNRTTAMTGHQDHPGTGVTLSGQPTVAVDLVELARTCGIEDVRVLDPFDLKGFYRDLKAALDRPGPSVIIAKYPCIFVDPFVKGRQPVQIDPEKCDGCGVCLRFGCPGVYKAGDKAVIDPSICSGCEMCLELCPTDAAGVRAASKRAPWAQVLEGKR